MEQLDFEDSSSQSTLNNDSEDSSSQSTLNNDSDNSDIDELPPDDFEVESSDDDDDGYDSTGNTSEPEEIIVDKRYPLPERPPPYAYPFLQIDGGQRILYGERRTHRLEDYYQPYDRRLSRGYEETGHPLRWGLRYSELVEGKGTFNGFAHNLEPRRITGSVLKRQQLFYFVEWRGTDTNRPFPLEAHIMTYNSPIMVLRYHQHYSSNPSLFRRI